MMPPCAQHSTHTYPLYSLCSLYQVYPLSCGLAHGQFLPRRLTHRCPILEPSRAVSQYIARGRGRKRHSIGRPPEPSVAHQLVADPIDHDPAGRATHAETPAQRTTGPVCLAFRPWGITANPPSAIVSHQQSLPPARQAGRFCAPRRCPAVPHFRTVIHPDPETGTDFYGRGAKHASIHR